jgi:hypothetical protein
VTRRLAGLSTAQLLLLALTVTVGVGALAVTVPALGNAGMLLAATALVAALAVMAQWLWQSRQSTDWDNTFTDSTPPRGADSRISRLAVDIREATSGNAESASRIHATVSGLAAERLRDRRGLTAADDARSALGPDLAAYLAGPPTAPLTAGRLAAFTTTLEEL